MMPEINRSLLKDDHDLLIAIWTQLEILLKQNTELIGKVEKNGAETAQLRLDMGKLETKVDSIEKDLNEHKIETEKTFSNVNKTISENEKSSKWWSNLSLIIVAVVSAGLIIYNIAF